MLQVYTYIWHRRVGFRVEASAVAVVWHFGDIRWSVVHVSSGDVGSRSHRHGRTGGKAESSLEHIAPVHMPRLH